MGIWLPLSEFFNENKLFLNCQIDCAIDLNHSKQDSQVLNIFLGGMSPSILRRVFQFLSLMSITRSLTQPGDIATSFMGGDPFSQH